MPDDGRPVLAPEVPRAEAKRCVVERFLTPRQGDGSLPTVHRCAV